MQKISILLCRFYRQCRRSQCCYVDVYFFKHSDNYSMTSGRSWNYHRDEVNDGLNESDIANNYR